MIWEYFFIICISILLISVVLSFLVGKHPEYSSKIINSFNVLLFGVFIFVLVSLIPVFSVSNGIKETNAFSIFFISLHNTFQVFTINSDLKGLLSEASCPFYYALMLSVEFVIAPLFTLGFFISLLKDFSSYLRLVLYFLRDFYIFTELNERSITLGNDIKKQHPEAVIVYTGINDNSLKNIDDLLESAKKMHAICFGKEVSSVPFKVLHKQIVYFAIAEDETKNIQLSLEIVNLYKQRSNTRLYIFAKGTEAELIFGNLDAGEIKIRRVNDIQSLIHRLLYEDGHKLFESAVSDDNGEKLISVMIIGLGSYGKEFLKAITWYCQMDGYHLVVDAYDIDKNAESRFEAEAPELMSSNYNGVYIPDEAEYKINIHSGIDINTKEFADLVYSMNRTTFVFVSIGSDEKNIQAATFMRMYFERMSIHPIIYSVVHDSRIKKTLDGAKNNSNQSYDIAYVGDLDSSYSADVILNSSLEKTCLESYKDRTDKIDAEMKFWKYDYNYRSKVASIIHAKARKECNLPGACKLESELDDIEKETIINVEHRRWNAYMKSEGWVYSGSTREDSRNDLGKMHYDLVPTSSLSEEEKRKDVRLFNGNDNH